MDGSGITDVGAPFYRLVIEIDRIFRDQQMERQLLTQRINQLCTEPESPRRSHHSRSWR